MTLQDHDWMIRGLPPESQNLRAILLERDPPVPRVAV
jgi:hypothetical protein